MGTVLEATPRPSGLLIGIMLKMNLHFCLTFLTSGVSRTKEQEWRFNVEVAEDLISDTMSCMQLHHLIVMETVPHKQITMVMG